LTDELSKELFPGSALWLLSPSTVSGSQTQGYGLVQGKKEFEVRWHPYQLNPTAAQEGVNKLDHYKSKFGEARTEQMIPHMTVCPAAVLSSVCRHHADTTRDVTQWTFDLKVSGQPRLQQTIAQLHRHG
jgi:hypothetical protein